MLTKQPTKSLAEFTEFSIDFEKLSKIKGGDDEHDLTADEDAAESAYDDGKKPNTKPRRPQA